MTHFLRLGLGLVFFSSAPIAGAQVDRHPVSQECRAPLACAHGPQAPDDQFPSHRFSFEAHQPRRVQLAFHYGLNQPIFLGGFNAAVDVRYRRFIVTYSHGQGLDVNSQRTDQDRGAGTRAREPWTTGGGIGLLLVDELYVLADVKAHHFEIETPRDEEQTYTNVTVGGEIGWRYFLWKGLNVAFVVRYWPQVYSSAGNGITLHDAKGQPFLHQPIQQGLTSIKPSGLFANVLVGWAFDL